MNKKYLYMGGVVLAAALLYPKFPSAVMTVFGLLVVTALIINWNTLKANFQ